VLLTGCGGRAEPVAYTDLSARLRPVEFPRVVRQIFRTRAELADYLRQAMPGNAPRIPPIDWSRREAILVAAGPRSSTGYTLRIVGVRETANHVVVTVHERTPTLGEPVRTRVTYPFRLITIRRIDKPLFLHWEGRP
jgi:hypothetical protein